jgi:hypothetical protein
MSRRLGLLLVVALLAGCSSGEPSEGFELSEFTIAGPGTIGGNAQSLAVRNSGEFPHTLVVTDSSGQVVAATSLIAPGESTTFDVDLDDGTYSFTCRIVAQTGEGALIDHFQSGMHATVEVAG